MVDTRENHRITLNPDKFIFSSNCVEFAGFRERSGSVVECLT